MAEDMAKVMIDELYTVYGLIDEIPTDIRKAIFEESSIEKILKKHSMKEIRDKVYDWYAFEVEYDVGDIIEDAKTCTQAAVVNIYTDNSIDVVYVDKNGKLCVQNVNVYNKHHKVVDHMYEEEFEYESEE